MSDLDEVVAQFCPLAIAAKSYVGPSVTPVMSKKSLRNLKSKSPLAILTVGGDEVSMAEVVLNAEEALTGNVFGVENFSTPPSSPERIVGKGNADSVAAPAPEWEIGQRVRVVVFLLLLWLISQKSRRNGTSNYLLLYLRYRTR